MESHKAWFWPNLVSCHLCPNHVSCYNLLKSIFMQHLCQVGILIKKVSKNINIKDFHKAWTEYPRVLVLVKQIELYVIHTFSAGIRIQAVQENGGPRRLVDIIRRVPEFSKNYFRSPSRRALFGGISLLGGFYVAQTISLSFGALGVNDVIAAVLCVLLTEYVTKFYYSRPKVTFPIALLNNFKMGFTYGLFIDAFKLAS
ncbi:hypothetical protein Fmac_014100 [Flemingia macrophylla]|uniref:Ycf20 n=1 Tax=Flemingia macrophylla TaxID=520843 RepID=A0ABD1MAW5_9FABA